RSARSTRDLGPPENRKQCPGLLNLCWGLPVSRVRGAPRLSRGAPNVGGVGGPCRGPPFHRPWNGGGDFLFANAVTPALKSSVRPELAMACASSCIWVSRLSHVDWWNSRLAPPKAFDGPCASSRESASTAPLNSASATTRVTRPHS